MSNSTNRVTADDALNPRLLGSRSIALILMAVMILPPAAIGQSTQPAAQPSPPLLEFQMHASCLLEITCDPDIFPLDKDTVNALINSTGVARAAFREVLLKYREDIEEPGKGVLEVVFEPMSEVKESLGQQTARPTPTRERRYAATLDGAPYIAPTPSAGSEMISPLKTILGNLEVKSESYGGAVAILANVCTRLQEVLNRTLRLGCSR